MTISHSPGSLPDEPGRFLIRLPWPQWILLLTVGLVAVSVWMTVGLPIYQRQAAIHEIKVWGGGVETSPGGPQWLQRMKHRRRSAPCDGDARLPRCTATPGNYVTPRCRRENTKWPDGWDILPPGVPPQVPIGQ